MSIPVGMNVLNLTAGSDIDSSGAALDIEVSVEPVFGGDASSISWGATGQAVWNWELARKSTDGGGISISVVHPAQAGFINGRGESIRDWPYRAKITSRRNGKAKTVTKVFTATAEQTTIDLDLIPDGTITAPGTAPVPVVTTVAGHFGAVTEDQLYEALEPELLAIKGRTSTELAQRLKGVPNGAVPDPTTGQELVPLAIPVGNDPVIINGKIASAFVPEAGTAAWYLQTELDDQVSRIGARWTIDGPASGTIGLIAWADDFGQHLTPAVVVPDSVCHLAISSTGWTYSTVDNAGTFHTSGSGTFDTPLAMDGVTTHAAEVIIDRENGVAYVHLPDGTTATVVDARIKTLSSKWAVIEDYRNSPANSRIRILEWWSDSSHSGDRLVSARARALLSGAWQNVVFNGTWANFGGSVFAPAQWRREGSSVRVRGSITRPVSAPAAGSVMFFLPLPPAYAMAPVVLGAGGALFTMLVQGKGSGATSGQVQYIAGGNAQLTFDFTYALG